MSIKFIFTHDQIVKSNLNYWGRNGSGICAGLDLTVWSDLSKVTLYPINSYDKVASSCYIQIPGDPKVIREIADYLLSIADQIDQKKNSQKKEVLQSAV
jgi:hypothetical protein